MDTIRARQTITPMENTRKGPSSLKFGHRKTAKSNRTSHDNRGSERNLGFKLQYELLLICPKLNEFLNYQTRDKLTRITTTVLPY